MGLFLRRPPPPRIQNSKTSSSIYYSGISNATQLLCQLAELERDLLSSSSSQHNKDEAAAGIGDNDDSPPFRQHRHRHRYLFIIDALSNILLDDDPMIAITRKCRLLARLYPNTLGIVLVSNENYNNNTTALSQTSSSSSLRHADVHLRLEHQYDTRIAVRLIKHPYQLLLCCDATKKTSSSSLLLPLKLTPCGITTAV
jgi:hypothetical protein